VVLTRAVTKHRHAPHVAARRPLLTALIACLTLAVLGGCAPVRPWERAHPDPKTAELVAKAKGWNDIPMPDAGPFLEEIKEHLRKQGVLTE